MSSPAEIEQAEVRKEVALAERRIERPYDLTELERDLAWAKGTVEKLR